MSQFAKLLLVATSLAPALGAFALNEGVKKHWLVMGCLISASLILIGLCYLLKLYAEKTFARKHLDITKVDNTDKESLAFIIAYLFPILSGKFPTLSEPEYWLLSIYVFAIIGWAVYHSNAFHFNPVLALFGYHFYEITADNGMKYLLIGRECIRVQNPDVPVVKLSDYVYLEVSPGKPSDSQEGKNGG